MTLSELRNKMTCRTKIILIDDKCNDVFKDFIYKGKNDELNDTGLLKRNVHGIFEIGGYICISLEGLK